MSLDVNKIRSELGEQINSCMLRDQYRLRNRLKRLLATSPVNIQKIEALILQIAESIDCREKRGASKLSITYADLPVSQHIDKIKKALLDHQVLIVAGETGSGKTTQLPKICLELSRGVAGYIGHTQPRRLAARAVSARIAEELNTAPGSVVGFKIRFNDQVSDLTRIKVMTDGILLAETRQDRFLEQYDTLIIDEAHERSLNIDFILGFLKQLLPRRPDLKIIITSATIDVERFSRHFNGAPVIEVSGRSYPVETVYKPLTDNSDEDIDFTRAIVDTVDEIVQSDLRTNNRSFADVLVFLPGEREIREAAQQLRKYGPKDTEVLPLYARLTANEQQRIFKLHKGRRIILSTNVAETSLTVPNIRYVIDTGLVRISRYSYKSKVQRLPIEAVSQASANQRKGRCGRVAEGVCYRLYDEDDFNSRPEFTEPEILRTNLASVILQMKNLRLGDIEDFPYLEAPDSRLIKDGYKLLEELNAINSNKELSKTGQQLARFPVDPRIGRMLIAGNQFACLNEVLIIASALSVQDPRERPYDKRQAADQAHQPFIDKRSDFLFFVNLWNAYEEERQSLSQNQLRKYCKKHFLSFMRMREWRDIHFQLKSQCKEFNFSLNQQASDYASIHKALLTGLLSHVLNKFEGTEYRGARNKKLKIFPASSVRKTSPLWAMCAEQIETNELYASLVAKIEPEWIEDLAAHLLKKHCFEPHWEKNRGEVIAFEQSSLFGLVVNPKKKVSFASFEPEAARNIFIREGLVNQQLRTRASFFSHNQNLIKEVTELENKTRRKDFLVDEEVMFDFYDKYIPQDINKLQQLESWLKKNPDKEKSLLMSKDFLQQKNEDDTAKTQFPDTLEHNGLSFPLTYHFEPGNNLDGVTVTVPAPLLRQLQGVQLEWLVPGLLRDKCIALVKGLPKAKRKNFVPVPEYIDAFLEVIDQYRGKSLVRGLARELQRMTGVALVDDDWNYEKMDEVFFMRIAVINEQGQIVNSGRSLEDLLSGSEDTGEQKQGSESHTAQTLDVENKSLQVRHSLEQDGLAGWPAVDLPEQVNQKVMGVTISLYPALVNKQKNVSLVCFDEKMLARKHHEDGLIRLLLLQVPQKIKLINKKILPSSALALKFTNQFSLGSFADLQDGICFAAARATLTGKSLDLRTQVEFEQLLEILKNNLLTEADRLITRHDKLLQVAGQIQENLSKLGLPAALQHADINTQIDALFEKNYLYNTPTKWLREYERYFQAIGRRLEKLPMNRQKDSEIMQSIQALHNSLNSFKEKLGEKSHCYEELTEYRWLLEELRVSLFAQELKTLQTVSVKRLSRRWQEIQDSVS